jgi:hypothetical protein
MPTDHLMRVDERQSFCLDIFEMKNKLNTPLDVNLHGVKHVVWKYYEFDDIVKELCKPIYWRIAVNPIIRRAVIAALFTSVLLSINPSGLFALIAFNLMLLISTSLIVLGIFELEILIIGAVLDLVDSLKILKRTP